MSVLYLRELIPLANNYALRILLLSYFIGSYSEFC